VLPLSRSASSSAATSGPKTLPDTLLYEAKHPPKQRLDTITHVRHMRGSGSKQPANREPLTSCGPPGPTNAWPERNFIQRDRPRLDRRQRDVGSLQRDLRDQNQVAGVHHVVARAGTAAVRRPGVACWTPRDGRGARGGAARVARAVREEGCALPAPVSDQDGLIVVAGDEASNFDLGSIALEARASAIAQHVQILGVWSVDRSGRAPVGGVATNQTDARHDHARSPHAER